ncbi:tensin-2-like isoform X2 [Gouania willdenowi]|uniref:tensin-2-like isoform X2 n=1 Tax=Gouania willdenowi TaxID=441366 RepID=UPI001056D702|nr:tensin-2-like isoform X2 [Gouania willdenowi]
MGCIHSVNTSGLKKHGPDGDAINTELEVHPEILQITDLSKPESHTFIAKSFRKRRTCEVCKQNIDNPVAFCKECKVAVHQTCKAKVTHTCLLAPDLHSGIKSAPQKKRGSIPRSVEEVMEHVMERHYDFDLTYITERIISVFFIPELEEQRYRGNLQEVASMLKSKHQDKFLLLNLSEKRHDITRLHPKLQEYGWPDLHAPPLDRICAVCKAMETWLASDPNNVVVLHCKGHKGKTGVIVAAYMHYSKISAGADQALTTLAMRKFCEDKVSSSLHPSQNRYIYYFGGLLSGSIKMNSSPLFLHQILIPSLPNFQAGGGFNPFLKIYQSLQVVYTSGVYDPQSSRARKLCVTMEPALLLKGDIMVKCYHRRSQAAEREVVFRVQFHTCTVHGAQLWFGKAELDLACTDDRFPPDATVEFIFSSGPEKMKGREYRKNDTSIKVDYNTSDPVVRWDSYEDFNLHHQDSMENIYHTKGPLDGSLYAQVRKRREPGTTTSVATPNGSLTNSPTVNPQTPSQFHLLSNTSNSTCSSVPSDHQAKASPSINSSERENADCLLRKGEAGGRTREKTRGKERDRETAILDDGDISSPGRLRREHSCCSRGSVTCADAGWERERDSYTSNGHFHGHCGSIKNHPKSQTLPAMPSKSLSPPPLFSQMECHRHSSHPLPELPWERLPPPPPMHRLHRPCCHYSVPEQTHPHSQTLPAANRLCTGEDCHLFHFSAHGANSHLPQPSSPYREMFFSSAAPVSACTCPDCVNRLKRLSAQVRTFHPLRKDLSENPHWSQGGGMHRIKEWETENPWEVARDAEFWQCKSTIPGFRQCHSPLEHVPNVEDPRFSLTPQQTYPVPQSLMDVRDGVSSGYHTPPQLRHSCPCSPHQSSPAESHESRGYVSGYHSGSASPLPASSPSPGRGRLPESPSASRNPKTTEHNEVDEEKPQDCIAPIIETKSDNDEPTPPGPDSDHDYTLIGSNSPTHTEDEAATPTQTQEPSICKELNTNDIKSVAQEPIISVDPLEVLSKPSLVSSHDAQLEAAKITPSADGSKRLQTTNYTTVLITPVQVQINGSAVPDDSPSDGSGRTVLMNPSSPSSSPSTTSPNSPIGSSELQSSSQQRTASGESSGHRLTLERDCLGDMKPPSPVPDGYHTPTFPLASYYYSLLNVPHVAYSGYTAVTIPAVQPPLPEKKRFSSTAGSLPGHNSLFRVSSAPSQTHHVTFSPAVAEQRRGSAQHSYREEADIRVNAKFAQDSSKFWYKPNISRDQAIAVLKDKEPGTFLIRDSNSFQGAYGLALKVATPPPNANITGSKEDRLEQLVRHFLIETGPRGVKIKGCQNESYFGSLSALVYQHSITPISLPCALHIPDKDLVGELQELQSATNTSTAADLLKQGAACNVLYLNSVETESLTGPEAVSKATKCTLALNPRPVATVVHFKVSSQGITLTDSKRRLFFRRHYPISSVTFSSLDPQDQRWINSDCTSSKMFGFVARRTGTATGNVCHLFAEMDPEQPAVAIVNFINKVMLGPQLRR